jgi:peroxiredoxin Q/BCP
VKDNAAFAQKFGFGFPLLCDVQREIGTAYGACADRAAKAAKRISYLIDEDGKVMSCYPNVQPADHPEEVLRDLG